MMGEPTCRVCAGLGTYPIMDRLGAMLYEVTCPECLGISDEEIERGCAEDRAALETALSSPPSKKEGER